MSIYEALAHEPRMICYSSLYQLKEGEIKEAYLKSFKSMQQHLEKETEKIEKTLTKYSEKLLDKNIEMLITILGEYLQTPLQQDNEEIRKTMKDSLEKLTAQFSLNIKYGLELAYISEVVVLPTQYALLKRLEKAGSDYLKTIGFETGKEHRKIYETLLIFESSFNIDLIEQMLLKKNYEDQLHIDVSQNSLYNLIYSSGAAANRLLEKEVFEVAFFFAQPYDIPNDVFQTSMTEMLDKLWVSLKIPYITLMKRKLGFGKGFEFVLRLYLPEAHEHLTETLRWLSMYKEVGFVRQALIDEGKLVTKKLIK